MLPVPLETNFYGHPRYGSNTEYEPRCRGRKRDTARDGSGAPVLERSQLVVTSHAMSSASASGGVRCAPRRVT